jgi:hypothetical protein
MKIYISHGDKGGVGKSMVAASLIDTIISADPKTTILLVEGDNTNPDVAPRFDNNAQVVSIVAPLNNPDRGFEVLGNVMGTVVDQISEGETISVVINTPAGFSDTFTPEAQTLLKEIAEAYGSKIQVLYSVGDTHLASSGAYDFVAKNKTGGAVKLVFPGHLADEETWRAENAEIFKTKDGFFFPKITDTTRAFYKAHSDKSLSGICNMLESDKSKSSNKIKAMMVKKELTTIRSVILQNVLK